MRAHAPRTSRLAQNATGGCAHQRTASAAACRSQGAHSSGPSVAFASPNTSHGMTGTVRNVATMSPSYRGASTPGQST